jgi:hypothetical protein
MEGKSQYPLHNKQQCYLSHIAQFVAFFSAGSDSKLEKQLEAA